MFFTTKKVKVGPHVLHVPRDMAWCFAGGEYYEKNVIHWFDRIVERLPDPVIYDVGANYGYFSVRYGARARAVYAFEPVGRTYRALERNLADNGLAGVRPFRLGLSNRSDSVPIHLYSSSGNNSVFRRTLPPGHTLKLTGVETISVVPLDLLVAREALLPPSIVKIDVEGGELDVLRGADQTIGAHRPFILLELGESTCRDAGYSAEELLHEIERHGYRILGLAEATGDLTLHPRNAFGTVPIANVIAVPSGTDLDAP